MVEQLNDMYVRLISDPVALQNEMAMDIVVDQEDVLGGMLRQGEAFLKWARLALVAKSQYSEQKRRVNELLWPQARARARDQLAAAGGKVTESRVEDHAYGDTDYGEGAKLLAELKRVSDEFSAMESAMWQRKDMLQSLNSRQRAELSILPEDQEAAKERYRKLRQKENEDAGEHGQSE